MIKGIEVGGVMYGITLADDMVGQGLVKDENGVVGLKILYTNDNPNLMTGLMVRDGALCLYALSVAEQLAGSGLVAEKGKLIVSGGTGGGSVNAESLVGCGLRSMGNRLYLALSGSNLLKFGSDDSLDVDMDYVASGLCGSGLSVSGGKLVVSGGDDVGDVGSGLFKDYGIFTVNISTSSGLSFNGAGLSHSNPGIGIKIAKRTSGLRLFFNSNGELDVTQD